MLELCLLLLFAAAAWYDYTNHKIPDVLTSFAWFTLITYYLIDGVTAVMSIGIAGAVFAGLFFMNTLLRLFAWGDILLLPVYVAYVFLFPPTVWIMGFLPFMLLGAYVFFEIARGNKEIKKQNIPLAPFIFGAALIVFAVRIAL